VVALGVFWKYNISEAKNNVYNLIRSDPFMEKEELDALHTQRRMLNEQLVVAEVTVILGIVLTAIGVLIYVNSSKCMHAIVQQLRAHARAKMHATCVLFFHFLDFLNNILKGS
jgi:hypothetical protein